MPDANLELLLALGSVPAWNEWRRKHPEVRPDFQGQNLYGVFSEIDAPFLVKGARARLSGMDLRGANLRFAFLEFADLSEADLTDADLDGAILTDSNLDKARLEAANLHDANLRRASLQGTILRRANLMFAQFNEANLSGADLRDASIYGVSAWRVRVDDGTRQTELRVRPYGDEQTITVDDIEIAQFIFALFSAERLRHVIDTVTSKVVLILGRFTEERKKVLDALRDELRKRNYIPVLFDFEKPDSRDLTETISTLAHMARFVIADITDAKSIPQELMKIIPNLPSLPVRPIILDGQYEYAMFKDFGGYLSVLPPWRYRDSEHLLASLETEVIGPALNRAQEIAERRKSFERELMKG